MFWNRKNEVPHDAMPIHHDRRSAFSTTAGNVAGEGLKGTAKGAIGGAGIAVALALGAGLLLATAIVFPGALTGLMGFLGFEGLTFGAAATKVLAFTGIAGVATVVGTAIMGPTFAGAGGLFGGIFGAGHGISKGHEQVAQERMAAQAVDQQLGAAQMQSQAMLMQAQAARSPFPPQGSAMNMASPKIDAAGAEHSKLAERQLQMA
jgi:hypothetical protein